MPASVRRQPAASLQQPGALTLAEVAASAKQQGAAFLLSAASRRQAAPAAASRLLPSPTKRDSPSLSAVVAFWTLFCLFAPSTARCQATLFHPVHAVAGRRCSASGYSVPSSSCCRRQNLFCLRMRSSAKFTQDEELQEIRRIEKKKEKEEERKTV